MEATLGEGTFYFCRPGNVQFFFNKKKKNMKFLNFFLKFFEHFLKNLSLKFYSMYIDFSSSRKHAVSQVVTVFYVESPKLQIVRSRWFGVLNPGRGVLFSITPLPLPPLPCCSCSRNLGRILQQKRGRLNLWAPAYSRSHCEISFFYELLKKRTLYYHGRYFLNGYKHSEVWEPVIFGS